MIGVGAESRLATSWMLMVLSSVPSAACRGEPAGVNGQPFVTPKSNTATLHEVAIFRSAKGMGQVVGTEKGGRGVFARLLILLPVVENVLGRKFAAVVREVVG